jgi:hypothetical protein
LFASIPPSTNPSELQAQHISTRAFIVLLGLSLSILVLYTSTVRIVKTVTVQTPDLDRYNQLYADHPQTLTCPCTKISMKYGTFLHINHSLHQVCSSVFVSEEFIAYTGQSSNSFRRTDSFQNGGFSAFQALRAICQLVQDAISISVEQFYSISYVNSVTIPTTHFQSQANTLVQQFISSTTKSFLMSLRMVRNLTHANALFSILYANGFSDVFYVARTLQPSERVYNDECNCIASSACITDMRMYWNYMNLSPWTLPGFYRGCYIIEALLKSNLECFYNLSCLDMFHYYLQFDSMMNTTALDPALSTRYLPTTSIGEIVDQMMVEKWNWSANHANYFTACQPKECTYTVTDRNGAIYIVTTVISLIGGLVTVWKILIPRIVVRIVNGLNRKKRNVVNDVVNHGRKSKNTLPTICSDISRSGREQD